MVHNAKHKLVILLVIFASVFSSILPVLSPVSADSHDNKVLVFVSDGMRQDLMEQYASQGKMPTYKKILTKGVSGINGSIPNVPANTGPGWTSLITGASPSLTGVTNNTFHNNTQAFSSYGVSAWSSGVNQAETLAEKADAEGKVVAALGWQAFEADSIPNGVVVEYYPDWLTGRGIIANYDVPLNWTNLLSPSAVMANTKVTLADAVDWTNVPQSYSPAKETTFSISDWMYMPVLNYNVYIYDSSNNHRVDYDKVLVSPTKDGAEKVAKLREGEWSKSIPASVNDWMGNPVAGGFYVKLIDMTSDLSMFRLYYSQVTRIIATPQSLEDDLASRFDAVMPVDYAPYLLGLIDAQTFVEQNTKAQELLGNQIYPYIINKYDPDLALVGSEWTDAFGHRFLGKCLPGTDAYDPATAPTYCSYIEKSYKGADKILKSTWAAMGCDTTVFVTSDHGFSLTSKAINANYILQQAGLFNPSSYATSQAIAYVAGGTAQIYVNLEGRNPGGVVPASEYDNVRQQIVQLFNDLGTDKIERIVLKEDTDTIETALGQTYNMLNENTTGDVVVFSKPPYQFDAASAGQVISDAPIYGQHGFVPNGDLDRYSVFAAYGPNINKHADDPVVTVLDLAPTVAHVLEIDPPAQSQGVVLDIFKH